MSSICIRCTQLHKNTRHNTIPRLFLNLNAMIWHSDGNDGKVSAMPCYAWCRWQWHAAFVLSRIDYCNAALSGLPLSTIEPLQRAQNAAARLVLVSCLATTSHRRWCSCTGCQVQFRIKFELCLLMHQIHVGRCPSYLAELVCMSADNCRRPGLRVQQVTIIVTLNLDCVQSLRNVHSRLLVLQSGIVFRVI